MFIFKILITHDNRPDNELFLFKLLGYLTFSLYITLLRQCGDPLCDYAWITMVYLNDQFYA